MIKTRICNWFATDSDVPYDITMAVFLEFINLIIPRSVIEQKYPGGWAQCLADDCGMWHDEHILRDGAMNPMDIETAVHSWESKGFRPIRSSHGKLVWNDLCVIEAMCRQPTLPCDWIVVAEDGSHAWLKSAAPGAIVGPAYDSLDGSFLLEED